MTCRFLNTCLLLLSALLAPLAVQAQPRPIDRVLFEASLPDGSDATGKLPITPAPLAATAALPSAPAPAATTEDVTRYLDAIAAEELANGPFTPNLLDPFLALGLVYQQQDDHAAALEALGKAEYISRINEGLYAPQQFAIVAAMIRSHLATGDLAQANERQQYLLFIQSEYYGEQSLAVVPALETLAGWNMDAFRSLLNQANAAGFSIGLNTRAGGTSSMPNPRMLAFGNLFQAQRNYYQAIVNLVSNRDFHNPLLPELEHSLIETIFLGANREAILEDPDFYLDKRVIRTGSRIRRDGMTGNSVHFLNGRNAWQRMRIYLENDPRSTPEEIGASIIGLGDWYMLFNRRVTALDHYREAHAYLQSRQVPTGTVADMLNPLVPQQLPEFTPLPHSRAKFGIDDSAGITWDGYIDVSFRISRLGNVRGFRILGGSDNVTTELERRLRRLLRSAPFRPRLPAGEPLTDDEVTLRYHFARLD